MFGNIKHFSGIVWHGFLKALNMTDKGIQQGAKLVDEYEPQIAKALQTGESIASIIPGVGPQLARGIDVSIAAAGALKHGADVLAALDTQVHEQLAGLAPSGYSFALIKNDVLADVHLLVTEAESDYKLVVLAAQSAQAAGAGKPATV